jgi:squalene-hopene/tetraprenyl-beta-curcumene cyclase
MGYAGFKSMVYAGLTREDPRVRAALGWIERNYTFSENPGMGTDGYYYFMLMAGRALGASRLDAIGNPSDPSKPRNWREDMIRALAEKQNADGSFRSIDDRWMENDPVLITAYSLIALQSAR